MTNRLLVALTVGRVGWAVGGSLTKWIVTVSGQASPRRAPPPFSCEERPGVTPRTHWNPPRPLLPRVARRHPSTPARTRVAPRTPPVRHLRRRASHVSSEVGGGLPPWGWRPRDCGGAHQARHERQGPRAPGLRQRGARRGAPAPGQPGGLRMRRAAGSELSKFDQAVFKYV